MDNKTHSVNYPHLEIMRQHHSAHLINCQVKLVFLLSELTVKSCCHFLLARGQ